MIRPHPYGRSPGPSAALAALALGAGCGLTPLASPPADGPAALGDTASGPATDTATERVPAPPAPLTEELPDQELDDSWIFSLDHLHEVHITLPPASEAALLADPYTYAEGAFSLDGVALARVGVRLRGKIGSFRPLTGKPKFKLDFNEYVDDQRLWGLEGISLNNMVVDCSAMKEVLAYRVFPAIGVAAPRAAYARVWVNGDDYGLYLLLETPDDRFLKRAWDEPDGNLYDGKYVWYPDGSYTLLDFAEGHDHLYQLEEGEDVGHADISSVSAALAAGWGSPTFLATTGAVLEWPQVLREWTGEQFVGSNDGYALNKNNYRVYFNPAHGRAELVPWDFDYSFLQDSDWGRSWASPYGNLAYACRLDPACTAAWQGIVAEALPAIEALDLPGLAAQVDALTWDATLADPRRECPAEAIRPSRDHVNAWVVDRLAYMRAFWSL
jgi:hypothetical protein